MKTTNLGLYAFRLTFSQAPPLSAQASTNCSHAYTTNSSRSNRVVTRSATMLALFGIALSSFSLKQLLAKKHGKHNALRKL
ncbi:uncharacterized protein LOC111076317 [Drosophila obscura]|uniref:uncharacterized protein LOC111076317 n=1 Tax=Drosophila obscura TaxID=7282 RepID=UPI000BA050AA|nr:uncharacterized protein LOC111076317 [Drosophila obscura]